MKTSCLVTGGCGFIGSHVTDLLIENGYNVTVVDNLSTGKLDNLNPKATFIKADIQDRDALKNLEADYVFHLAALARIQPSIDDPVTSHETNVNGTLNILELCRRNNAKIIFSSSSSLYKGDIFPTGEEANLDSKNPYTLNKLIGEQYIELYSKLYGLNYTILRYFNVFGERQITVGAYAAVVGIFLEQYEANKPLTITNDGKQRRDFTYVKDVAQANLLAMDWSGIVNIGYGENYAINELAGLFESKTEYIGKREGEVRQTLSDNTKAKSLGWMPTKGIKEWILEQI